MEDGRTKSDDASATTACEPLAPEVLLALELLGFRASWEGSLPAHNDTANVREIMDDWRQGMDSDIQDLPWGDLKGPLRDTIDKVYSKVMADGHVRAPGKYALLLKNADRGGRSSWCQEH